jgi:hypothetical protein
MSWRPYIISNIYGKKKVMRDTRLYKTKEEAIRAMKSKNKKWMELNYDKNYTKMSNFEYGAIKVGKSGYKFPMGTKGNQKLLDHHVSKTKPSTNKQFKWF